jgi:hypothetical protein
MTLAGKSLPSTTQDQVWYHASSCEICGSLKWHQNNVPSSTVVFCGHYHSTSVPLLIHHQCHIIIANTCIIKRYTLKNTIFMAHGRLKWMENNQYISIYIQQDATLHTVFISGNRATCFRWYFHPSSAARTTVSTATGICHTVTATCRYSGR